VTIQIRLIGASDTALLDAAVTRAGGQVSTGAPFLAQPASLAFVAPLELLRII
jgi:hypothetical protein